ncbi:MAG: prepilin-type N-terminal cleavage/methylation domain-containing protein [Firmicutes bacterium]|nr:prepilin-type N-terminal cleavage/methylation domain-containing protein [Bacillota bacterium]
MRSIWRKEKGFTLIELLIVVAIIGILAGIAVPRLSKSTEAAKEGACKANMSTLVSAIETYKAIEGSYPSSLDNLVSEGYIKEVPTCPSGSSNDSGSDQYEYNLSDGDYTLTCPNGHTL